MATYNVLATPDPVRDARIKLSAATHRIINHRHTRPLAEVIYLGKSEVISKEHAPPGAPATAWTDGVNKYYVAEYVNSLKIEEVVALILHENYHVALRHLPRIVPLSDMQIANQAADYVVNDVIVQLAHAFPTFVRVPANWLYDPQFSGWSMPEIYRKLAEEKKQPPKQPPKPGDKPTDGKGPSGASKHPEPGNGPPPPYGTKRRGEAMDHHDTSKVAEQTEEEAKELADKVQKALQRGAIMAGAMGVDMPQAIKEGMIPDVNWEEQVTDWLTSAMKGGDEYTYARFDRRMVAMGLYQPGTESITLGSGLVSFDTSGSTLGPELDRFVANIQVLLEQFPPDEMRVLWWDTKVRSEQRFTPEAYADFTKMVRAAGGGGTRVGCVDDYMREHGIRPDFHVIMTDGYVESQINWQGDTSIPTLWIVTLNRHFKPPFGQMVFTGK